ncbi:MAG: hypothetical protein KDA61_10775 [Planctomycetales bacterium]|nr:hypothetical protein [Planctomycetales bacterium]
MADSIDSGVARDSVPSKCVLHTLAAYPNADVDFKLNDSTPRLCHKPTLSWLTRE